jgi:hypothetical protein
LNRLRDIFLNKLLQNKDRVTDHDPIGQLPDEFIQLFLIFLSNHRSIRQQKCERETLNGRDHGVNWYTDLIAWSGFSEQSTKDEWNLHHESSLKGKRVPVDEI